MMDSPLASRAEAAIRRLRDVDGVSVRADGDELVEIHVVSRSDRPAKHIVRDVDLHQLVAVGAHAHAVHVAQATDGGFGPAG